MSSFSLLYSRYNGLSLYGPKLIVLIDHGLSPVKLLVNICQLGARGMAQSLKVSIALAGLLSLVPRTCTEIHNCV